MKYVTARGPGELVVPNLLSELGDPLMVLRLLTHLRRAAGLSARQPSCQPSVNPNKSFSPKSLLIKVFHDSSRKVTTVGLYTLGSETCALMKTALV